MIMDGGAMSPKEEASWRLREAAQMEDRARLAEALGEGGDPNARDERGWSALDWAARFGWEEGVLDLLKEGGDPNAKGGLRVSPLSRAILGRSEACARILLEAGADPKEEIDFLGKRSTVLMRAAEEGMEGTVRLLLLAGADWRERDSGGRAAEDWAEDGEAKGCKAILEAWRVAAEEKEALERAGAKAGAVERPARRGP